MFGKADMLEFQINKDLKQLDTDFNIKIKLEHDTKLMPKTI